ncbi:MAG: ABC transporter ATP-binding protein [Gemmatimonadetes bacterium]|nr:ABC transporter ATP-binding protein [Gemmatimonadota bacterium]
MKQYIRLLRQLAPYRMLLAAALLATFMFAALDTFSFVMVFPFLDALFKEGSSINLFGAGERIGQLLEGTIGRLLPPDADPLDAITALCIAIAVVFLLKNVFDYLRQYLVVRLEQSVTRDLRNTVYTHLLELDLRFYNRTRAGQIINRLTSDTDLLRTLVTKNISTFFTSVLQVIIAIWVLLEISWQLTLLALVVMPLTFGIWRRLLAPLRRGDRRVLEMSGEVTSHLQETVSGVRQVKAAAAESFESNRFRNLTESYFGSVVRTERIRALASPLSETMGAIGTVLLLWFGGRMVVQGALTAGAFITFIGISLKLYQPVKWLTKFPSMIQPGLSAADRIFEFLDTPAEMVDSPEARVFDTVNDAIRFENVSFSYTDDAPVLRDIELTARRGTVTALVGPSGAGKTTLVDLAARFYDPTAGRITVDGIDVREFSVKSLRSKMGVVTQETVLFHDTVRSNIAYALPDAAQEAVERAARAANAHDFIMQMPHGYDTVLGERGTRLSGGQRQRIAIARAILRDPPILIFDEATSALDSESERLVQEAIEHLLEGRTVFVIAHRLSTILKADQIVAMEGGRIVQRGTHDELVAEGGLYRKLYRLQSGPGSHVPGKSI